MRGDDMEIIGEKINSTRKNVEQAIRERNAPFIQEMARRQAETGANYLDINSGMPLYPEEEAEDFAWLVPLVQAAANLPLCIDSAYPQVIETALKLHQGRAMINSINGDQKKMDSILPMAKEFGCKVIALTSSKETGIPATSAERMKIAEAIAEHAQKIGYPLEDIYFDPLVLPLSTDHTNGVVFLDTLREIKRSLKPTKTVSGLSNISYGLPRRKRINHAFLVLALSSGMDAAILDPTDKAIMAMVPVSELIAGQDPDCAEYLAAFREGRFDP
jgi:cobalamin-dependent methionine synthase I